MSQAKAYLCSLNLRKIPHIELSAQVPLIHMSLGLTPLYRKLELITMRRGVETESGLKTS